MISWRLFVWGYCTCQRFLLANLWGGLFVDDSLLVPDRHNLYVCLFGWLVGFRVLAIFQNYRLGFLLWQNLSLRNEVHLNLLYYKPTLPSRFCRSQNTEFIQRHLQLKGRWEEKRAHNFELLFSENEWAKKLLNCSSFVRFTNLQLFSVSCTHISVGIWEGNKLRIHTNMHGKFDENQDILPSYEGYSVSSKSAMKSLQPFVMSLAT